MVAGRPDRKRWLPAALTGGDGDGPLNLNAAIARRQQQSNLHILLELQEAGFFQDFQAD